MFSSSAATPPLFVFGAGQKQGPADEPKSNMANVNNVDAATGTTNGVTSEASKSPKGKASDIIKKDDKYFMESNFVVFQVQKCLFRVPSYLFSKESHVFGGLFNLPQPDSKESEDCEGSSASNPIILPDDYLEEDFRCLMKALYPLSFSLTLKLAKSEWISVLKISSQWYFGNLRKAAISELERLKSVGFVEKILLGRKYQISSWIVSGYVGLVNRETTINDDEAIDIDSDYMTTAYKLYRLREERIKTLSNTGFSTSVSFQPIDRIEIIFRLELEAVRADEKGYTSIQEEIAFEHDDQGIFSTPEPASVKKLKGKR